MSFWDDLCGVENAGGRASTKRGGSNRRMNLGILDTNIRGLAKHCEQLLLHALMLISGTKTPRRLGLSRSRKRHSFSVCGNIALSWYFIVSYIPYLPECKQSNLQGVKMMAVRHFQRPIPSNRLHSATAILSTFLEPVDLPYAQKEHCLQSHLSEQHA